MRLLTRSDYDGLMCAVLLKELGKYDEIKFVHPKDIQDNLIEVTDEDILVNIPYVPGCGIWFDHHTSEQERGVSEGFEFKGASWPAPSCARVIYEYYKEDGKLEKFEELLEAADKADSAQFTRDEILNPTRWVLLSFIMDPRTGLGRYRDYRVSNYQLMMMLIDELRTKTVDEILALEDVQERVRRYEEHKPHFLQMMFEYSTAEGDVIVTDLRDVPETYIGNRHVVYALYPYQNISIRIFDGKDKEFCVFSVGYSILNRTSTVDVGSLMLKYGGGGHKAVGTCQVAYDDVERIRDEMLRFINVEHKSAGK
ncbi:MAG: exopolyphosphatase [Synergistaceae bacterium]|jgi:oligoribonuclease NrnB/cAMP/cGMP phosphodiesterase (DHH superfamily)|nr:exopolyphosphatase [Synergistaceae bacterium]